MALVYRFRVDKLYLDTLISRYWQQRPLILRPAFQYALLATLVAAVWVLVFVQSKGVDTQSVVLVALAWALLLGPGAYWLTRLLIRQRFTASSSDRKDTDVALSDDGVVVIAPMSRHEIQWPTYSRGVRFSDGIMLIRPRVILWLPDSALTDANPAQATALVGTHASLAHVA
jgi:hypothetical protein